MRLILKTRVKGHYLAIMEQFDRDLFEALAPPIGKMEIVAFTGSQPGDYVHLRFLSPVQAEWISDIVDAGSNDQEAYFVDEGQVLPPPLRFWHHRHIVRKIDEESALVIDDITYHTRLRFLDLLIYPLMWMAFFPRKYVYRRYFGKNSTLKPVE